MKMIEFDGAKIVYDEEGEKGYENRGKIVLAESQIVGAYDHTILTTGDHKIFVMETYEEIKERLK